MQETQVRFLGWEDSLEKEMAILSSILAWEIQCTKECGRLQSMGSRKSDTTEQQSYHHRQRGVAQVTCLAHPFSLACFSGEHITFIHGEL